MTSQDEDKHTNEDAEAFMPTALFKGKHKPQHEKDAAPAQAAEPESSAPQPPEPEREPEPEVVPHSEPEKKRSSFSFKIPFGKRKSDGDAPHSPAPDSDDAQAAAASAAALGLSGEGLEEVQKRLSKLTLALTVSIAVAVFALLFAGWMAWSSYSADQELKGSTYRVVVAADKIEAGTTIESNMLTTLDIPASYVSQGATSDATTVTGKRATVDIPKNTTVTSSMVSGNESASSAADKLGNGKYAVSVDLDTDAGVSGLVNQGDRVEVIASSRGKTKRILKKVRVIALDAKLSDSTSKYSNVTLELTEKQVETLRSYESNKWSLSLALDASGKK